MMKKKMYKASILWGTAILGIGILLGFLMFRNNGAAEPMGTALETEHQLTTWTCSMHPQIRQPEPGQCPICGMDLIPLAEDAVENDNPMMVHMSETAARLANIQTVTVETGSAVKTLRLNGKVVPNERLVKTQSSHISGRVEQLFINTTGEQVRQGQKLASLYSPELITAQQELLQGVTIKESQPALYRAAREKLKSLRITDMQIDHIESDGKVQENMPIYADRSGIVLKKMVNVGDYLKKGEALFTIADLSQLWVVFDAYESDLSFLQTGDEINFTVASLAGKEFSGKVTFIDPIVNPQSRTAQVRVEISNPDGRLKPEMFAKAEIKATLGSENQMTVPKNAVMWTGERSVIYVQVSDGESKGYELREVSLGPSLGNAYVIENGLEPGEKVVANGTFTVDAAAQLAGKPSMMNPDLSAGRSKGGMAMTGHNHVGMEMGNPSPSSKNASGSHAYKMHVSEASKAEINQVLQAYFTLKDALVTSQTTEAASAARKLEESIKAVKMQNMKGGAHKHWMEHLPVLNSSLSKINEQANIDVQRRAFVVTSEVMVKIAKHFGPFENPIYVLNCPMADNNTGADWLSKSDEILNPYYGDLMLKCGEVKTKIQ